MIITSVVTQSFKTILSFSPKKGPLGDLSMFFFSFPIWASWWGRCFFFGSSTEQTWGSIGYLVGGDPNLLQRFHKFREIQTPMAPGTSASKKKRGSSSYLKVKRDGTDRKSMEHPPSFPLVKKNHTASKKKWWMEPMGPGLGWVKAPNIFTHNMSVWGLYRVFSHSKPWPRPRGWGFHPGQRVDFPNAKKKLQGNRRSPPMGEMVKWW